MSLPHMENPKTRPSAVVYPSVSGGFDRAPGANGVNLIRTSLGAGYRDMRHLFRVYKMPSY